MALAESEQLLVVIGGLIASAFALARLSFSVQRGLIDRFASFLEASLQRQEAVSQKLADSVEQLSFGVQESTQMLRRLSEHLQVSFHDKREVNS